MKVEIDCGYSSLGHYDLEEMADETVGQLVKGLLRSKIADSSDYKHVTFKILKEETDGDT